MANIGIWRPSPTIPLKNSGRIPSFSTCDRPNRLTKYQNWNPDSLCDVFRRVTKFKLQSFWSRKRSLKFRR